MNRGQLKDAVCAHLSAYPGPCPEVGWHSIHSVRTALPPGMVDRTVSDWKLLQALGEEDGLETYDLCIRLRKPAGSYPREIQFSSGLKSALAVLACERQGLPATKANVSTVLEVALSSVHQIVKSGISAGLITAEGEERKTKIYHLALDLNEPIWFWVRYGSLRGRLTTLADESALGELVKFPQGPPSSHQRNLRRFREQLLALQAQITSIQRSIDQMLSVEGAQ